MNIKFTIKSNEIKIRKFTNRPSQTFVDRKKQANKNWTRERS